MLGDTDEARPQKMRFGVAIRMPLAAGSLSLSLLPSPQLPLIDRTSFFPLLLSLNTQYLLSISLFFVFSLTIFEPISPRTVGEGL
jgi:hypothetical protein